MVLFVTGGFEYTKQTRQEICVILFVALFLCVSVSLPTPGVGMKFGPHVMFNLDGITILVLARKYICICAVVCVGVSCCCC